MKLDCHIHIATGDIKRDDFISKLNNAGITGGSLLSIPPNYYSWDGQTFTVEERLDNLFMWTDSHEHLYPFLWMDPMEEDALEQVDLAVKRGVKGFKVICSYFHPGETKAMDVYSAIAKAGKPMLFHSGILWDGHASSKYNRPAEFEALLEVKGLKFALAHVSWPWCDESIAVYGKFLSAYKLRPDLSVEMFIDISPGTPPIYREEVLTKLFTIGYDIENNVLFGIDSTANNYGTDYALQWIERDGRIYEKLGLSAETKEKIYWKNLQRFIGI